MKKSKHSSSVDSLKILLVDDELAISDLINEYLSEEDNCYSIETAYNGLQALKLFKKNDFDLVITDSSMPRMDGDMLVSEIRSINKSIPIIMMTGFGAPPEDDNSNGEIDLFIEKPIKLEKLEEEIKKLCL